MVVIEVRDSLLLKCPQAIKFRKVLLLLLVMATTQRYLLQELLILKAINQTNLLLLLNQQVFARIAHLL